MCRLIRPCAPADLEMRSDLPRFALRSESCHHSTCAARNRVRDPSYQGCGREERACNVRNNSKKGNMAGPSDSTSTADNRYTPILPAPARRAFSNSSFLALASLESW